MKKRKSKRQEFINFNDVSVPLGKRKQAYVKWLMEKKGYSLDGAKLACSRKFKREEKALKEKQQRSY